MHVLVRLKAEEGHAKEDGQPHEDDGTRAMVGDQRVVGDGDGDAGAQQDRGVEGRDRPRPHGRKRIDDARRRAGVAGCRARPHRLEVGPEERVVEVAEVRQRVHARPVERAEEGAEEHHLREDEPAHAPAERDVDALAVEAAFALADRLAEPLLQHERPHHEAGEHHPRTPRRADERERW